MPALQSSLRRVTAGNAIKGYVVSLEIRAEILTVVGENGNNKSVRTPPALPYCLLKHARGVRTMTNIFMSQPCDTAKKNAADEEGWIPDSIGESIVNESCDSAQR